VLESKARGIPDLRLALTQHPIGGLRPPIVAGKAEQMVEQTVEAITGREPAMAGRA